LAFSPVSLIIPQYQNPADNTPASGFVMKAFKAGTTTNISMATNSTGSTTFTSVALNSSGYPEHLSEQIIPYIDQKYKLSFFADQANADANTNPVWSIDNNTPITVLGDFTVDDAVSGGVTNVISQTHTTTGTPTVGIGVGQTFIVETGVDNNETGMIIEAVTTNITATSEDFDYVLKLMKAGAAAAEVLRVNSLGVLKPIAQVQQIKGADVASATALPVLTDGNYFDVTGTTTVTSINTTKPGTVIGLHFDGALILTHDATNLILPSAANITTAAGDEALFVEYATGDYRCLVYTRASGEAVVTNLVNDLTPQLGGDLSANSNQIQWSKGADVASATALPVLTDGNYFDVTGTTTITSINTTAVGTVIKLHFDGILTLTHDATNLILPSAANITTAAGDEFEFLEYASGDYRCTAYVLASGRAVITTESVTDQEVVVTTGNGHGSSSTNIRRFTTTQTDVGSDITYADSSTLGGTFTINTAGIYAMFYSDADASASGSFGISVDSSQLTTSIVSITAADRLGVTHNITGNLANSLSIVASLSSSAVIRAHTDASTDSTSASDVVFRIRKIGTV